MWLSSVVRDRLRLICFVRLSNGPHNKIPIICIFFLGKSKTICCALIWACVINIKSVFLRLSSLCSPARELRGEARFRRAEVACRTRQASMALHHRKVSALPCFASSPAACNCCYGYPTHLRSYCYLSARWSTSGAAFMNDGKCSVPATHFDTRTPSQVPLLQIY